MVMAFRLMKLIHINNINNINNILIMCKFFINKFKI